MITGTAESLKKKTLCGEDGKDGVGTVAGGADPIKSFAIRGQKWYHFTEKKTEGALRFERLQSNSYGRRSREQSP